MNMSEIAFLVKLRDACQLIADAANEFLETKGPVPGKWDPSKITWERVEGSKGFYQRSRDVDNLEFQALLKDLTAHKGKMRHKRYFYWLFQDGTIVGRKALTKT